MLSVVVRVKKKVTYIYMISGAHNDVSIQYD